MKKNWLKNKTVIISGASGGLGFGIAKLLIEKFDCRIIGIARNEEKIKKAILTLGEKSANFEYRIFDVNDRLSWLALREELEKKSIIPDVLINNAGFMLPFSRFDKYSDEEITEIINTNFIAHVNAVKILLPILKKSSTPSIINIVSAAGLCAIAGESMYCATKFAMRGFTETLQQDYKRKVYVAGIYPGFIKTDILQRSIIDAKTQKLVDKFMMPLDKAVNRIVKRIAKRKKRTVMGFDGRFMWIFSRFFPSFTPNIITDVFCKSKLELFKDVFED